MKTIDASIPAGTDKKSAPYPEDNKKRYSLLYVGLWSIIAYFIISHFILMSVQIEGASMSPTLQDGERYTLFRYPYLLRTPQRGEIVVIRDPQDHNLSIKRIIALPNDLLQIKQDGVYVNDQKILEPYLSATVARAFYYKAAGQIRLGARDYFVLGDNRNVSADSRIYGPVPRNFILGLITK